MIRMIIHNMYNIASFIGSATSSEVRLSNAGENEFMRAKVKAERVDADVDFAGWCGTQAAALRERRWGDLDTALLAEEVDDLGRAERRRLQSFLEVTFLHLLKLRYQPERRSASWTNSVAEHARRTVRLLEESPSLKSAWPRVRDDAYEMARYRAADETGIEIELFPATIEAQVLSEFEAALVAAGGTIP